MVTLNQPMVEGDTIRIYYGGTNDYHTGGGKAAIGLATLRKDGFASLDAGSKMGTVTTRPLIGSEGELHLNTNASGGWVKVEILDSEGNVIEGYGRDDCASISADAMNQKVTWSSRSELPETKGSRRFRFLLVNAALYSFMAERGSNWKLRIPPCRSPSASTKTKGPAPPMGQAMMVCSRPAFTTRFAWLLTPIRRQREGRPCISLGMEKPWTPSRSWGPPTWEPSSLSRHRRSRQRRADFRRESSVGTLSLTLNGQRVQSRPRFFRDGRYHHFAATHNRGEVKLYLDGNEVASERIRAGTMHLYYDDSIIDLRRAPDPSSEAGIHLAADLRVGEDQGGRFITYRDKVPAPPDNQLRGWVDDILVVRRVLSAEEIAALNNLPDR